MHYAARNGWNEVATLLINSGANLDSVDKVSYICLLIIIYNAVMYIKV